MATMIDKRPSALSAGVVKIGNLRINRLGFGAMRITGPGAWGSPSDPAQAKKVLRRAAALDINFFDTADAYGPAVSEQLIHDALYPYDGLMIATKGGLVRGGPGDWRSNATPEHLRKACEASLERLGIDQISLYQLHRPDPEVPFALSVRTLVSLQQEGLIRHIGLSNVTLDQLRHALELGHIVSVQNRYNLTHRRDSDEIVDFCEAHDIAFIPYFPIGGGMNQLGQLTIQAIAEKHQATSAQIALAWLLARSQTMLPIPGTASIDHLEENVAASQLQLSDRDIAQLDSLSD